MNHLMMMTRTLLHGGPYPGKSFTQTKNSSASSLDIEMIETKETNKNWKHKQIYIQFPEYSATSAQTGLKLTEFCAEPI